MRLVVTIVCSLVLACASLAEAVVQGNGTRASGASASPVRLGAVDAIIQQAIADHNIPGAVLGGLVIGFVESLSGQFIGNSWSDVVIFSILILVLVFRPNGLLGMQRPQRA